MPPAVLARRTAAGLQPDQSNCQQHRHTGAENNPVQNVLLPPAPDFKRQPDERQDEKFQRLQLMEWMPVFAHAGGCAKLLSQCASGNNHKLQPATAVRCAIYARTLFSAQALRAASSRIARKTSFPRWHIPCVGVGSPRLQFFAGAENKTTTQPPNFYETKSYHHSVHDDRCPRLERRCRVRAGQRRQ